MATTIHDVARMAGVSIKTVSNVLNGYASIRPATKQRVLEAIESLDWTPNLTARGLRSGRTGLINLIIPDLRNAYFAELSDVLMEAADAQGLSVIVAQTRGQRRRELDLLRGPRAQMVDGILFSPLALGDQDTPLLATVKTPMVLLGERILDGPKDLVTMHNVEGARAATRHLLDQGRRRILAFGSDASLLNGSANLRLIGYRQALEDAGVPYDPALTVDVVSWLRSTGAAAMRSFLEQGIAFDGVVAFNDLIALGSHARPAGGGGPDPPGCRGDRLRRHRRSALQPAVAVHHRPRPGGDRRGGDPLLEGTYRCPGPDDPCPRTSVGLPSRSARVHGVAPLPLGPLDTCRTACACSLYNVFL